MNKINLMRTSCIAAVLVFSYSLWAADTKVEKGNIDDAPPVAEKNQAVPLRKNLPVIMTGHPEYDPNIEYEEEKPYLDLDPVFFLDFLAANDEDLTKRANELSALIKGFKQKLIKLTRREDELLEESRKLKKRLQLINEELEIIDKEKKIIYKKDREARNEGAIIVNKVEAERLGIEYKET